MREEMASALETVASEYEAHQVVSRVRKRWSRSNAVADALYVPIAMADMAGQLMVHTYEAPDAKPAPQQTLFTLALGDAQDPSAFLNKPWDEALEEFRARGVVSEDELSRLLREWGDRSIEARRAMLDVVQKRVYELLDDAIAQGQTFPEFAGKLRAEAPGLGITADDPAYLQNVFRTNVMSAYGAGRLRALNDPDVIAARPFRQIRTVQDARVRDEHAPLDGLVYRADGPLAALKTPFGFQCFPGHVEVQGTFSVGMRALYDGEIVEIVTQHGRRLSVTPNHPIATVNGFVAAGSIREGDQILGYERPVQGDQLSAGSPVGPESPAVDEHHAPTPIEQVFRSLEQAGCGGIRRRVPDDFHGDALSFKSDVDVVWTNRELPHGLESGASQDGGDLGLTAPHALVEAQEGREREGGLGGSALRPALGGGPRGAALPADGSRVLLELRPLEPLRVGPAANLHASRYEYAADGAAGDAKFVSDMLFGSSAAVGRDDGGLVQLESASAHGDAAQFQQPVHGRVAGPERGRDALHGLSGRVSVDYVVSVERAAWNGHVYDLQSPYGWIVASGIVTSNCRCQTVSLSEWDGEVVSELPAGSVAPGFG